MVTSPAASEKKSTMETGTGGGRRKLKAGKPKEITSSFLAPPTVSGLFEQLEKAIALVANGEIGDREREALGDQILQKYSWSAVAKTTENLYLDVLLEKEKRKKKRKKTVQDERDDDDFANRVIEKCTSQGVVFGPLLCCIAALTKLYLKALEFADPAENIRERSNFLRRPTPPFLQMIQNDNGRTGMMLRVETTSISVDFSRRKEKEEQMEEDASESFSRQ